MSWYYAINQEQKGPISEEEFQQLLRAGTVTPKTLVWQEGMPQWIPYGEVATPIGTAGVGTGGGMYCAECGNQFNPDELVRFDSAYVCAGCKPTFVQRIQEGGQAQFRPSDLTEEDILAAPYEVDIGECLNRGWNGAMANLGAAIAGMVLLGFVYFVGAVIVSVLDEVGMEALSLPAFPVFSTLLTPLFAGPITGGFFMLGVALARNEGATVGLSFSGFSRYGSCVMCALVQTLIMFGCLIPAGIIAGMGAAASGGEGSVLIIAIMFGVLVGIGLIMYLTICWLFAYQLILDKGYGFWEAMSFSRKVVRRRWWMTFVFYFVGGFIAGLGVILLLIGLLFTVPAFAGMVGALYDENLGKLRPKQA